MHFHVKKNHGCPKTTNQKPKITGTYGNVTSPENPQNQLFSLMNYVHFCNKDLIFIKVGEKFFFRNINLRINISVKTQQRDALKVLK